MGLTFVLRDISPIYHFGFEAFDLQALTGPVPKATSKPKAQPSAKKVERKPDPTPTGKNKPATAKAKAAAEEASAPTAKSVGKERAASVAKPVGSENSAPAGEGVFAAFFRCAVIRTYFLAFLGVLTVIRCLGLVTYFRAGLPSRFQASGSSEASETKKVTTPKKKNKKDAKEDTHTPVSKGPKTDTDDEDDKPPLKRPAGKGGVKLIDMLALTWRHRFFFTSC